MLALIATMSSYAQTCATGFTCTNAFDGTSSDYPMAVAISGVGVSDRVYIAVDEYDHSTTNPLHHLYLEGFECNNASCSSTTQVYTDELIQGSIPGATHETLQPTIATGRSGFVNASDRVYIVHKSDPALHTSGCAPDEYPIVEDVFDGASGLMSHRTVWDTCLYRGVGAKYFSLAYASNRLTAAFTEENPGGGYNVLQASRYTLFPTWGLPALIPGGGGGSTDTHNNPHMIVDDGGDRLIAHHVDTGTQEEIRLAFLDSSTDLLFSTSSTHIDYPALFQLNNGDLELIYKVDPGGDDQIQGVRCGGTVDCTQRSNWTGGGIVTMAASGVRITNVQAASSHDEADRQWVIWSEGPISPRVFMTTRCGRNSWSTPVQLRSNTDGGDYQYLDYGRQNIYVDSVNNTVHFAFIESDDNLNDRNVWWVRGSYAPCP